MRFTAKRLIALDEVSTLPLHFRARLAEEGYGVGFPAIDRKFISSDALFAISLNWPTEKP